MRIIVCVKQVIDGEAVLEIDGTGQIAKDGQVMVIDGYSEIAVEKAVQFKEALDAEVIAICIGDDSATDALRHALSIGADSAILLRVPEGIDLAPDVRARLLAEKIRELDADIVMGGFQSQDTSNSQVMMRIAALLGVPCLSRAISLEVDGEQLQAILETDDGMALVETRMPAVVSVQQGMAEPRYPGMKDVIKARRKSIEEEDAAITEDEPVKVQWSIREARGGGKVLSGDTQDAVAVVISALRNEWRLL